MSVILMHGQLWRRSFLQSLHKDPNAVPQDVPRAATGGGSGVLQMKPFKVPASTKSVRVAAAQAKARSANSKRARVEYTENDFYTDLGGPDFQEQQAAQKKARKDAKKAKDAAANDDDDDDKSKKRGFQDKYVPPAAPRVFPVYRPKSSTEVMTKSFTIPGIKRKGQILDVRQTNPSLGMRQPGALIPRPLHDPLEDHAIVLWDPTVDDREAEREAERLRLQQLEHDNNRDERESIEERERKKIHRSLADILGIKPRDADGAKKVKVPVVIDPKLGKILRPHQVEGVKFLYRCVTGMTDDDSHGCIMADEMGLGKTASFLRQQLQCISLMWTLLKQSPAPGKQTIDKAIVICPSSLVRNWANELVKWLGEGAINPLALDGKASAADVIKSVRQWCTTKGKNVVTPVIIVSYERLRMLTEELGQTEVGLMLADEGHRLKNCDNLTYTSLNQINCKRRVILTGTPIQNDLNEYFSLLNFCNPGYLGTRMDFHKKYENPILKGREGDATDKQKDRGDEMLKELAGKVNKFIIRRTNDLLSKYLPVKYEHVVFCSLSPLQLELYKFFMQAPSTKAMLSGQGSQPLKAITILRKLVNHPDLLSFDDGDLPGAEQLFPEGYDPRDKRRLIDASLSGKMALLDRFLVKMRSETNDKIVLISNFTQTLDLMEKMMHQRRYGFLRLDGTMNTNKRQKLVDRFNDPEGKEFVFLLSSKAGGCGINLIGANRLILFDPDWNPASDMQALARVWRDGQKKNCFVYRFVATGTVEEKIFQRQSHKQNLSSCVVDSKDDVERFYTADDLRQLFKYKPVPCETHDLFKCKRCKAGKQVVKAPCMLYGDTSTWNHLTNECLATIHDDLLRAETGVDSVTACFQYIST
ncbi:DNA-dependent ATPase protein rad54 [Microbotryomycetes sp. JL221]|nr:DNA-dependent ATPase protein rad54 [Microbotryomycetes sp. JL221]